MSAEEKQNYFEVLGVTADSTDDEVKDAYRKLSLKHHPDRGGDKEEFERISNAYEALKDAESRKFYAETGHSKTPRSQVIVNLRSLVIGAFKSTDKPITRMLEDIDTKRFELKSRLRGHEQDKQKITGRLDKFRKSNEAAKEKPIYKLIESELAEWMIILDESIAQLKDEIANCEAMLVYMNGISDMVGIEGAFGRRRSSGRFESPHSFFDNNFIESSE